MLVQVDIDNTLYDSDKAFAKAATEFNVIWPKNYYKWMSPEDLGTDLKTLLNVFRSAHSKKYFMDNKPYEHAAEVLDYIAQNYNVEIAYVSDRNEQQGTTLREWLEQEGFLHDKNQHVIATKDKRKWMRKELPNIVIEDRIRTILMARYELDSHVVSLEHNYNQNLLNEVEGIYICKDWLEIKNILEELLGE